MLIPFDNTYSKLPDEFFARIEAKPVGKPAWIQLNRELIKDLGIEPDKLESDEGLAALAGNERADGADLIAMAYSGHQFGGFSPQLGDGRAMLLGEVVGKDGVRRDIQLKGSGPTPFSRRGDGRSALGPVLREYIVSEAMAALGVPTTRALAAVSTGEEVYREGMVPGGVFTRVAQSHIRVGTFEWFASRQDTGNLRILADYVIDRHFPDVKESAYPYRSLLDGVIERQANLIAHWMQFGFIHGVMNTDNMTVSGETIDYGPCAFMDAYHPAKKFSSIDQQGRYSFSNQATIGHWNLTRFAETLLPLLSMETEKAVAEAEEALSAYAGIFQHALQRRFLAKIGVCDGTKDDWSLVETLLAAMAEGKADFTLVFRHLPDALNGAGDARLMEQFSNPGPVLTWLDEWRVRLSNVDHQKSEGAMRKHNPIFIPRNHRVEEAIEAGYAGDFEPFHRLNRVLKNPFEEQPNSTEYESAPDPDQVVEATFCGT